MIDTQVLTMIDGAILCDHALRVTPDRAWFEPEHWQAQGRMVRAAGGRGGVAFVETPVGTCALRHYRRGGMMARLSADRYLWLGAARTRAFREFRLLAEAAGAGLPVAPPVAARYRRRGLLYRADLLTRRIESSRTLAEALRDDRTAHTLLAGTVGAVLARFFAAGFWHADLNASNILVDGSEGVWLIDFDRGRRRLPHRGWHRANLMRLRRSLEKLGFFAAVEGFDETFWKPLVAAAGCRRTGASKREDVA